MYTFNRSHICELLESLWTVFLCWSVEDELLLEWSTTAVASVLTLDDSLMTVSFFLMLSQYYHLRSFDQWWRRCWSPSIDAMRVISQNLGFTIKKLLFHRFLFISSSMEFSENGWPGWNSTARITGGTPLHPRAHSGRLLSDWLNK